ncbi:MAG: hypothetical protein AAB630_02025 [Patescibacteria group bacterium]
MFLFICSILAGVLFFIAAGAAIKKKPDRYISYGILMGIGIGFIIAGTFVRADNTVRGTPLRSIEPGKYTVIKMAMDASFVTDANSISYLLLKEGQEVRLYALPTNELHGNPIEGGILEISEIPSSQKMVFHK